jgi:hypothetical protein
MPFAHGQQSSCDTGAFREVVAKASASINEMQEKNSKVFQEKLQGLRASNGWSEAEFVAKATPYVKDETTTSIDADNQALLAKVQTLGGNGAPSEPERCAMLQELKALMDKVVANTGQKWQHMLSKVSSAPAGSLQAGLAR